MFLAFSVALRPPSDSCRWRKAVFGSMVGSNRTEKRKYCVGRRLRRRFPSRIYCCYIYTSACPLLSLVLDLWKLLLQGELKKKKSGMSFCCKLCKFFFSLCSSIYLEVEAEEVLRLHKENRDKGVLF